MSRKGLARKTLVSLSMLASSLGASSQCFLPNSHILFPNSEDLINAGLTNPQPSIEESFRERVDVLYPAQRAFISRNEPDMISSVSNPNILRVADRDSPYGFCLMLLQFPGPEKYRDKTVLKAILTLPQVNDPSAQSGSSLEAEVGRVADPWNMSTLSYNSPYLLTGYYFSHNPHLLDSPTAEIDLKRVPAGGGGQVTVIETLLVDNNGIVIHPNRNNQNTSAYKTIDPHGINLRVTYILYTDG